MMQESDLDSLMGAMSPPPLSLPSPSADALPHDSDAALSVLNDIIETGAIPWDHTSAEFADLLEQYTLPSNMLSPEAMRRSPVPSGGGAGDLAAMSNGATESGPAPENGGFGRPGHEEFEYAGGGAGAAGEELSPGEKPQQGSSAQLAAAIANMDSSTQQQLLAVLIAQQQAGRSRQDGDRPTAPVQPQPQPAYSQPPSQHPSPQAFQLYPDTLQQHQDQQIQHHLAQQYQLATSLNGSHPPSHTSSPLASPYFNGNAQGQYFQQQLSQHYQHQQQAQQLLHTQQQGSPQLMASSQSFPTPPVATFHNAFSPRPFGQPQTTPSVADVQAFFAMDAIARASAANYAPDATDANGNANSGPVGEDMRIRGGSATGGSYATTADTEDWGDSEFMFSPLMSPALAPHSTFTPNSSLPPSGACPPGVSGITPGEYFTPLGSPAIMPQSFQTDFSSPHPWPQPHHTHNSSLQGLVDQTTRLNFDVSQQPGSPSHHYSPTSQSNMSPRLGPTDAGHSTGAGSGKRGAGGKKARPSPLLKPTPDSAVRKKKAPGRSSSIGSGGRRSTTTSPFLGPTSGYGVVPFSAMTPTTGSTTTTTTRPSPEHSSGSNNTPSPVDLAMHEAPSSAQEQQELMGPPPVPSGSNAGSRRSSLTQNGGSSWLSPVTPASFMNFSADIPAAGLVPIPGPSANGTDPSSSNNGSQRNQSDPVTHDVDDGDSAHSTSTAGPSKPRTKKAVAARPSLVGGHDSSSSNGVASSSTTKPPSSRIPVEQPPTRPGATAASKGKGRAGSVSTPGVAGARNIAKGPGGSGPKIKPLLPDGLSADAVSRLSTKSNYQNILEGRGAELFGFDSSTVSGLQATQGAGADNRRTSHKAAEQKRRDSLKLCFEELRRILPPIAASAPDEEKRPGEGNVGGQRGGSVDPENPNRGVSKVALLRRSNEYVGMLHDRIERRDLAIDSLRASLRDARSRLGEEDEDEVEGMDLDHIDKDERAAGTMAFYDRLDSDDEDTKPRQQQQPRRAPTPARRKSNADAEFKGKPGGGGAAGARRSTRRSNAGTSGGGGGGDDDSESAAMDVEDGE